jgi:hypothetical protein
MRPISVVRFNALAGYCRRPETVITYEELAWFEHANERLLGMIAQDLNDGEFAGIIYGRDQRERFRSIYVIPEFETSERRAKLHLRHAMDLLGMAPDEAFHQGDEKKGSPLDFFTPLGPQAKLHPIFRDLLEKETRSAARGIIKPMMKWYEDPDGNFVEQFQTTAFDARIWELYLFAMFRESGYMIDRSHAVPDFVCSGLLGDLAVEAVTVNPSPKPGPELNSEQAMDEYLRDYLPIRLSSSLTSKLAKAYWKQPHIANMPFVFAIQDFSAPGAMLATRPALRRYLYGYEQGWSPDHAGRMHATPVRVSVHRWNGKEIPSDFFSLPNAENVSAVLFNSSGTISKFNRMGVVAGFGSPRVRMIRRGIAVPANPSEPNLREFQLPVTEAGYSETWIEGLDVYHNPRAKHPLDPRMLPDSAHFFCQPSGELRGIVPPWHPLFSCTDVSLSDRDDEVETI